MAPPADLLARDKKTKVLVDKIRKQLGNDLATALAAQQQLTDSLEINRIQGQRLADRINSAEVQIQNLDSEITRLDAEIRDGNKKLAVERKELRILARNLYKEPESFLVQLAQAETLGEVMTRFADLYAASSMALRLALDLRDLTHRLDDARNKLESDRSLKESVRLSLAADLQALTKLRERQQAKSIELSAKIHGFALEASSLDKQSADLAQQIADLLEQEDDQIIAEAMQSVWDQVQVLAASGMVEGFPISPNHSKEHRFIWPEPKATITQGFGPTPYVFEPPFENFPHFHAGLDLAEPLGSPVLAADDGVVLLVGDSTVAGHQVGYGNYVVIAHADNLTTLYGHLITAVVKPGDKVKQGQPIGLEGSTGNSTGPHCHFELRIDGQFMDPTPYLPPGPSSDRQ